MSRKNPIKALRVFSVESNHIGEIDGKFFKKNPLLEMVYLADNNLEEVSPVLFKHNANLEFLHLDKNKVAFTIVLFTDSNQDNDATDGTIRHL